MRIVRILYVYIYKNTCVHVHIMQGDVITGRHIYACAIDVTEPRLCKNNIICRAARASRVFDCLALARFRALHKTRWGELSFWNVYIYMYTHTRTHICASDTSRWSSA